MAMCPLLRGECITIGCAWWFADNELENSQCSVSKLPDLLKEIADDLWDKSADVNGKLDDVADDICNSVNALYTLLEGGIPVSPDRF